MGANQTFNGIRPTAFGRFPIGTRVEPTTQKAVFVDAKGRGLRTYVLDNIWTDDGIMCLIGAAKCQTVLFPETDLRKVTTSRLSGKS